jgi:phenylacetic acid degradation operon negative regulatory protein
LPREVLAADWPGPAAARVFERLVAALERPALTHAATYWPGLALTAADENVSG